MKIFLQTDPGRFQQRRGGHGAALLVRCFLESRLRPLNPWTRAIRFSPKEEVERAKRSVNGREAFTLVESIVALALVSLLAISLVGMTIFSGKLTRAAREQLTAAEILESKVDALRSCSWGQLKQTNFIQPVFSLTNGILFTGTIQTAPLAGAESYVSNVMQVTISVNWQTGGRLRNLETTTFISRDGLSAR